MLGPNSESDDFMNKEQELQKESPLFLSSSAHHSKLVDGAAGRSGRGYFRGRRRRKTHKK